MKPLSVIAAMLVVIGVGNLMNDSTASTPVALPAERATDCDKCPITVEIPAVPTYAAAIGASDCGSCRRPIAKATGKVLRVPGKAVKKAGKVIVRSPIKAVRAVGRAKPVRRVLGRIFGRRR